MEKNENQGGDVYAFVAWADKNRKQLLLGLAVVILAGAVAGLYVWHKTAVETTANAAFCAIKVPAPGEPATPALASEYAEVADNYPDTSAGARAMLMAGSSFFETGDFGRAEAMFERFLSDHPDNPLADEAAIGVATCLEAQGKAAEAVARYRDILQRPPGPTTSQARSSLARIYTQENKPEDAMQQYVSLLQARQSDSWTMEAQVQLQGLLEKNPELKQKLQQEAQEQQQQQQSAGGQPPTTSAPTPQTGKQ
jgi:predicted negative regulator of RcsB-dependent stress response